MWTPRCEELANVRGLRFAIDVDSQPATFEHVMCGWQSNTDFCLLFNTLLAEVSYTAFRWETPAVTTATMTQPFQFVLLDSPSLARRPHPEAFAAHFTEADADIAVFPNLGGDATMVVPYPVVQPFAYGHLAAFVRLAPESQRLALWKAVGDAMRGRVNIRPVWLSTAGAGVPWLHIRLDDRPKYYGFRPYT